MIVWTDTMWRPLRHTAFRCHSLKPKATAADPLESPCGSLERRDVSSLSAFIQILCNNGETGLGIF